MATDAIPLGDPQVTAGEAADFILTPDEVAKGAKAVESYLESLKPGDGRRSAEDALQTLALLFTEGLCEARDFPWQQVKAYHGTAAINILKEQGTPARLEALRFERDPVRKYRQVPTEYAPKHVQKLRNSLRRVLRECHKLGFLSDEERAAAMDLPKAEDGKRPPKGRILTESEFRALTSACQVDQTPSGNRDALICSLGYQGGLQVSEIIALNLTDMRYDTRRGQVIVYVKGSKGKGNKTSRGRTVPLQNGALISLEDWLAARGDADGPLLCPIRKGGRKVEIRRMTATAIRLCCNKRAEQAGVAPFSPNDLRRSAATRRNDVKASVSPSRPSALYAVPSEEEVAQQQDERVKVLFPYRTRKAELL